MNEFRGASGLRETPFVRVVPWTRILCLMVLSCHRESSGLLKAFLAWFFARVHGDVQSARTKTFRGVHRKADTV